ncbi:hypothetical protein MMPV_009135 [Pyropia vietnamensis]
MVTWEEPVQPSTLPPEGEAARVAALRATVDPHVQSFSWAVTAGLALLPSEMEPLTIENPHTGESLTLRYESLRLSRPVAGAISRTESSSPVTPTVCRRVGSSYRGALTAGIVVTSSSGVAQRHTIRLGEIPIMLRSAACHLEGLTPTQLLAMGEEEYELGGYFVVNGLEKVIRMVIVPRRHHVLAVQRPANASRGAGFTDTSVSMRCGRPDTASATLHMHALTSYAIVVRVLVRRSEYFVPLALVIRALLPSGTSDADIYMRLVGGDGDVNAPGGGDPDLCAAALACVKDGADARLSFPPPSAADVASGYTNPATARSSVLQYLGARFRVVLDLPVAVNDEEAGRIFLRRYILIHLSASAAEAAAFGEEAAAVGGGEGSAGDGGGGGGGSPPPTASRDQAKVDTLVVMARKLVAVVRGRVESDNLDALSHQELLLPGFLYLIYLKERLGLLLTATRAIVQRDLRQERTRDTTNATWLTTPYLTTLLRRGIGNATLTARMEYFMATGNIQSESGLDLMQVAGYVVVAERINYLRFLAHFRSVHRGQFFVSIRTTTVRKLLPEAWGFLCPVHTPDGTPCGLLNHITSAAMVTIEPTASPGAVTELLVGRLGASPPPASHPFHAPPPAGALPVVVDGWVAAYVQRDGARALEQALRRVKVDGTAPDALPAVSEVVYVPPPSAAAVEASAAAATAAGSGASGGSAAGFFPGIFVHTGPARLVRPVRWLRGGGAEELIGSLEQVFLRVADAVDGRGDVVTLGAALEGEEAMKGERGGGAVPNGGGVTNGAGTSEVNGSSSDSSGNDSEPEIEEENSDDDSDDDDDSADPDDRSQAPTHAEISAMNMLSVVASLTPFSDMNQSPRNMYQCQMGKQALGTPAHNFASRTDAKVYRLTMPAAPLVRNEAIASQLGADVFPNGFNAVVAVLSYTGYDMEDAMTINRASLDRGLGHGIVYTNDIVDLDAEDESRSTVFAARGHTHNGGPSAEGDDGLPRVGEVISQGDALYSTISYSGNTWPQGVPRVHRHKSVERAFVDEVLLLEPSPSVGGGGGGGGGGGAGVRRARLRLRYSRNPVVGDKFASRAGQKGTVAALWPAEDMPFSESGLIPDILFNPNGFPSRMTIGMMVESMAGKAAAAHGVFQDSTPFRFDERRRAVDYFAEQLVAAGFAAHGSETLYSGYTGEPFTVNVFMGVVHYQRLRHMVSDKFQVRSTGPINPLTRQPIKGRKVGGAIRFGEMERDALLGHGAAFLLHDRLASGSDLHVLHVCAGCGSLLSPVATIVRRGDATERELSCRRCIRQKGKKEKSDAKVDGEGGGNSDNRICRVAMPYVAKYLVNELAAMNIQTIFQLASTQG